MAIHEGPARHPRRGLTEKLKTWVEISSSALASNARALKSVLSPETKLIAVVKSNAYGHGTAAAVKSLAAHANIFAVDSIDEAHEVRAARKNATIIILGYTLSSRMQEALRCGYQLTIASPESVRLLASAATKKYPARIHVKIETGTSRQGILLEELPGIMRTLAKMPFVVVEGMSTHFANIEDTENPQFAKKQLRQFEQALSIAAEQGIHPRLRHTAASGALLAYPETHFDAVRAGIALYGLWPAETIRASTERRGIELAPALSWRTRIAQIKKLPKGATVSYGRTEKLQRDSRVAVLPIGYWDGFDRKLSSVGHVLVHGRRAKVLGRVCMNMTMVDVTDIPHAAQEDIATIIGADGKDRITADEIAAHVGTINYEIVTRINPQIPRILVH